MAESDVARPSPEPPLAEDPLAETLHMLRLTGTLYCRAELTAPWGLDLPAIDGCMMFGVVTAGRCWLEVEGDEPRLLRQGSLVLLPHGTGFCVRSGLEVKTEPLFDIPVERVSDRYEIMRFGGGGEFTHVTCGVVRFDHVAAQRLLALLPRVLELDAWEDDGGWLQSTLRFITREAKQLRPGGETVITRLADILIIQAIRKWLDSAPEADLGWLGALRDEQLGRALAAIHREPQRQWTVVSLAEIAGMSRSAFSARFTDLVGESVMRYLTQWRMQLAHVRLRETSHSLSWIAEHLGYRSDAAFSRAFKRVFGTTPGSVRRNGTKAPEIGHDPR